MTNPIPVPTDNDAVHYAYLNPDTTFVSQESGDLFEHESHPVDIPCRCNQTMPGTYLDEKVWTISKAHERLNLGEVGFIQLSDRRTVAELNAMRQAATAIVEEIEQWAAKCGVCLGGAE